MTAQSVYCPTRWVRRSQVWRFACTAIALAVMALPLAARAEPKAGDVFREYRWTNAEGDAGGSLRVGGSKGYGGGSIAFPHELDLEHATRAEVVVEKLLCHAGTRGLAISWNDQQWIVLPEASAITAPQWDYQHHIYPMAAVPLEQLKAGGGNEFRMQVDTERPKWPQNLVYGVHLRIYYDAAEKPHPTGRVVSPAAGAALGSEVELKAEASSPNGSIARVDFVGCYEDVNLEGDGVYRQWHAHYVRAELAGHLGSATAAPWAVKWDTSWVPDQTEPMQIAARITDEAGLTYVTEPVGGLTFARGGLSVELCKPYDVPAKWVTRTGEHEEKFRVEGELGKAVAAQLVWCSWSPGYMEGLYLNGHKVFEREGPHYAYFLHRVPLADLSVLKSGENVLKTGKTPRRNGKMVHGAEINWPGIMVLIQYAK
ncbi:MAG: Ig-like domain-containing protein [Planctomycetota bacterium]